MKYKILMADDEPDVLSIMAKKIAEHDYDVVTAKDGVEAWEKIQSEAPDIILLDLNMPGLDGFSVLKALRDNPSSAKWQPVIIISARGELQDVQKGLSLEAEHYLVKPCTADDVLKAIRTVSQLIPLHKTEDELASEINDDDIELIE